MITTAIISLAQNLRLGVIAEGVETREQMEYIRANGCLKARLLLWRSRSSRYPNLTSGKASTVILSPVKQP
ncbi:MAG: hypothetical protein BRC56_00260 [Cyanobacteria bacterium SW_9_47_5]|nr:MAG: hypothetical protein BRC56_00260 [Cyanobacteria bacterium SW_9_47_5]